MLSCVNYLLCYRGCTRRRKVCSELGAPNSMRDHLLLEPPGLEEVAGELK